MQKKKNAHFERMREDNVQKNSIIFALEFIIINEINLERPQKHFHIDVKCNGMKHSLLKRDFHKVACRFFEN